MKSSARPALLAVAPAFAALALLSGCASTLDQRGLEQRTAMVASKSGSKSGSNSPAPTAPAAATAPAARGRNASPECNALLKAAGRC